MDTGDIIVAAAAGLIGGFIFLYGTDFALREAAWCIESDHHCFREWVSALSGWAAAIAAAVTGAIILRQIREQRAQSEFALGLTDPTAYIRTYKTGLHTAEEGCRLVIVNWNRQPIRFEAVRSLGGQLTFAGMRLNARQVELQQPSIVIFPDTDCDGWTERSTKPPAIICEIVLQRLDDGDGGEMAHRSIHLHAVVTVIEAEPRTANIHVRADKVPTYAGGSKALQIALSRTK